MEEEGDGDMRGRMRIDVPFMAKSSGPLSRTNVFPT